MRHTEIDGAKTFRVNDKFTSIQHPPEACQNDALYQITTCVIYSTTLLRERRISRAHERGTLRLSADVVVCSLPGPRRPIQARAGHFCVRDGFADGPMRASAFSRVPSVAALGRGGSPAEGISRASACAAAAAAVRRPGRFVRAATCRKKYFGKVRRRDRS